MKTLFLLVAPILLTSLAVSAQTPPVPAASQAPLAKSNGVFGVSVRHIELNEPTGVNDDRKFQMASVFKVPVLLTLYQQVEQGKVRLEERVRFEHPEHFFGSGVLTMLNPGLQPTVHDLATLMIILSDNAATDMICERVGLPIINVRLRVLGATQTTVDGCARDLTLRALDKVDRAQRHSAEQHFLRECPNCTTQKRREGRTKQPRPAISGRGRV